MEANKMSDVVVTEVDSSEVEATSITEAETIVEQATVKTASNVDLIVENLKLTSDLSVVTDAVAEQRTKYQNEAGKKALLRQVTAVFEGIKNDEKRFNKRWKLNTLGLVVDTDEIDKKLKA
jgi:hypothetical protein